MSPRKRAVTFGALNVVGLLRIVESVAQRIGTTDDDALLITQWGEGQPIEGVAGCIATDKGVDATVARDGRRVRLPPVGAGMNSRRARLRPGDGGMS